MNEKYDVFISHSTASVNFVRDLVHELDQRGIRVFYDQLVPLGTSLEPAIRDALKESRSVVLVLDQSSASSNWTAFELGAALGMGKRVVPVLSPEVMPQDIPAPIRGVRTIPKGTPQEAATEVIRALQGAR